MRGFLLCLGPAMLLSACTPAPITLQKIGEACDPDATPAVNCDSKAFCKDKICTINCAAQKDCPPGMDCGIGKAGDDKAVCYKANWDQMSPTKGQWGESCSAVFAGCGMGMSPCAAGFDCQALSTRKCDPSAICTKNCAADADCPYWMFCADGGDAGKFCWNRGDCGDCLIDEQCQQSGMKCILDAANKHYCAKGCTIDDDCHGLLEGGSTFAACVADRGGRGTYCLPAVGYCKGPSAVGLTGDGVICSPCRLGVPSDCAGIPDGKGICYEAGFTKERFCSAPCTATTDASGRVTKDDCPDGSFCAAGRIISMTYKFFCSGDSGYSTPTCYP